MCLHDVRRGRPVVLQHVLDQVDAAARRIEFVAEQHVASGRWRCRSRSGRRSRRIFSDSATSASASCASVKLVCMVRLRSISTPAHMRPGFEHALRVEAFLDAPRQRRESRALPARTPRPRHGPRPARGSASHDRRWRRRHAAPARRRHRRNAASASQSETARPVEQHPRVAAPPPGRPVRHRGSAPSRCARPCASLASGASRQRRDVPHRPPQPAARRPARCALRRRTA